jgi:chromosome condensin MukBEF MukE localization factor
VFLDGIYLCINSQQRKYLNNMATKRIELSDITKKSLNEKVSDKIKDLRFHGREILMLLYDTGNNIGKYSFQNRSSVIIRTAAIETDNVGTGIMDYVIYI